MLELKKNAAILLLFFIFLLPFTFFSICANTTNFENTISNSIDVRVDHIVKFQDGGLTLINNSIGLSTESGKSAEPLEFFSMGFPFKYGKNLLYVTAYETLNPSVSLKVIRSVQLGKESFYGINIVFPNPIDIGRGKSYNFTVFSVFSDLITSKTENPSYMREMHVLR